MKVNISLLQIDINTGKSEKNYLKVKEILENLPKKENHIAILPELWISGYSYDNLEECSEYFKNILPNLKNLAKSKNINIVGSVPWQQHNIIYNRSIFINNNGEISVTYDKIHLFRPLNEDKYFKSGSNIGFLSDFVNIGLVLCYDLRFPELVRELALKGADIVIVSAEWPLERINHWELLNKARALENQIYIVSCNRCGTSFDIDFGGHSMIVSPFGEVLVKLNNKEKIKSFTIDLSYIEKSRKNFNILKDIRLIK